MKGGETYPKDIQLLDPLDKPVATSPATMTSSFTTEETVEKAEKTQEFCDETMLQLEKIKTERDQLLTEIKLLSTEKTVLTKKLETLTKELEKVTKTCERLEKMETRLALGQVARLLEKVIWKAVLPDEEPGTVAILNTMENWLEENKSNGEGIAAQKRWDDLKLKLNWKEKRHKKALKLLKDVRMEDPHPSEVDLEVARQQLIEGGHFGKWQIESCTDIIDMLKMLKNLN